MEYYRKPRYMTADPRLYPYLTDLQKGMRLNSTKSEDLLWQAIRNKKLGYRFRRQHIIDIYIVDFVCIKKKLVIEVDGVVHKFQKARDFIRDKRLEDLGFNVLRFPNRQVDTKLKTVLEKIKESL